MILFVFILSLLFIIFAVVKLHLHPFLSMILASIIMGIGSQMNLSSILTNLCTGFGDTMGDIGILILLGVILGELLHNSGATRSIAEKLLSLFGAKNTPLAINITGYLVCIPVFFDAAFIILLSLLKELAKNSKIPLNVLVCSLSMGMMMTHAMVIPTPGPLAVAGITGANIAWFIFYSIIISLPASYVSGILYGKYLRKHPTWGVTFDDALDTDDLTSDVHHPSNAPVNGYLGIFLILLPILLIVTGTILKNMISPNHSFYEIVAFLLNTNVILLFTVFFAFFCLRSYLTKSFNDIVTSATESVGSIIAIICAGGGFATVINQSGLGDFLVQSLRSLGIPVIFLAFLLTQILRMGLGSTTVSLVTSAAVVAPLIAASGNSPVIIGLAVCAGGIGLCMPNDTSFWTISKFSGFSFNETIKVLTVSGTIAGFTAFILLLILNMFSGILPGLH